MVTTFTRTVVCSPEHRTCISVDKLHVVPACITRFDPGTRVEVARTRSGTYVVRALEGDHRRVFEPETWHAASR